METGKGTGIIMTINTICEFLWLIIMVEIISLLPLHLMGIL